ncbi:MAG: hypothetical protein Pg6A_05050 [Termitinemataceae bacterium]|nr:MAG: hypothetical protein Pg6A_05050 [Termitinemataceae bacterium]
MLAALMLAALMPCGRLCLAGAYALRALMPAALMTCGAYACGAYGLAALMALLRLWPCCAFLSVVLKAAGNVLNAACH